MIRAVFYALISGVLIPQAGLAIPNSVLGSVNAQQSPLNGQELSPELMASALWNDSSELPGEWQIEASVTGTSSSYLLAFPKFMGLKAVLVRATHRDERLEELQITFADAGSFFGYYLEKPPQGLSLTDTRAWHQSNFDRLNGEFQSAINDSRTALKSSLGKLDRKPREITQGRTRTLKAEMLQFRHQDLSLRLLDAPDRLLRLTISRDKKPPRSWLDQHLAEQPESARLSALKSAISRSQNGDLTLPEVKVVPQGYRPYCGLNTLAMVARYLGLHLDEDWLAVAGKFQNTGTAAGSQMLSLYQAVAKEAGFKMERQGKGGYVHSAVRRSLQQGMPVIVWRRWSSERDREHRRVSAAVSSGRGDQVKFPADASVLSFPDDKSPLHASVIIGFNDERKEVIFLESWAGQSQPRRMSVNEMQKTAYLTFAFHP